MSYIVTLHSCGGSMGEAIDSIGSAVVADEATATEVADHFNDLNDSSGYDGSEIYAVVEEVPELMGKEDAIAEIKKAYVFEDMEGDE